MAYGAYKVQRDTELFFASQINDKTVDLEMRQMYLDNVDGFAEAARINLAEYWRMKKHYMDRYPHYNFSDCM